MPSGQHPEGSSRAIYLLCFFVFAGTLVYTNSCGLYSTHDSKFYLQAARMMQEEGRFELFYSAVFSHWPPLYPFILSFFTQLPALYTFLHTSCLLLSFGLWLSMSRQILRKSYTRNLYAALLGLSTPWLLVGHFVWSEAVFILLFSAYLYFLLRFMATENSFFLVAATPFAFLLPWQRVAGVFVFMGVAAGVVLFYFPLFKKHWQKWVLHGLLSSFSFVSWFAYTTFVLEGRSLRDALGAAAIAASILQSVQDYLQTFSRWLVPEIIPDLLSFSLVVAFLVVPIFFIDRKTMRGRITGFLWSMMLVYLLLYISAPAISAEVGGIDETERFLSVIYPVFFLSLLFSVEQFSASKKPKLRRFLLTFIIIWLLYPTMRFVKNAHFFHVRKCQQSAKFSH